MILCSTVSASIRSRIVRRGRVKLTPGPFPHRRQEGRRNAAPECPGSHCCGGIGWARSCLVGRGSGPIDHGGSERSGDCRHLQCPGSGSWTIATTALDRDGPLEEIARGGRCPGARAPSCPPAHGTGACFLRNPLPGLLGGEKPLLCLSGLVQASRSFRCDCAIT